MVHHRVGIALSRHDQRSGARRCFTSTPETASYPARTRMSRIVISKQRSVFDQWLAIGQMPPVRATARSRVACTASTACNASLRCRLFKKAVCSHGLSRGVSIRCVQCTPPQSISCVRVLCLRKYAARILVNRSCSARSGSTQFVRCKFRCKFSLCLVIACGQGQAVEVVWSLRLVHTATRVTLLCNTLKLRQRQLSEL